MNFFSNITRDFKYGIYTNAGWHFLGVLVALWLSIDIGRYIQQEYGFSGNLSGNLILLFCTYIYFMRLETNRFFFKDILRVTDLRRAVIISLILCPVLILTISLKNTYFSRVATLEIEFNCAQSFFVTLQQIASLASQIVVDQALLKGIICILLISKFGKSIGIFLTICLSSFIFSFTHDGPNAMQFSYHFILTSIYLCLFLKTSSILPGIILKSIFATISIFWTCIN